MRALSLDTSAKLVKAAGAELVRPHMPLLVPAMLESLRWVGGWVSEERRGGGEEGPKRRGGGLHLGFTLFWREVRTARA